MYKKVVSDMKFPEREKKIAEFWRKNDIFEKSINCHADGVTFTFYDGPPTANGKPHIGHVLTRVIKDLIPRYRTMKGYKILRKAGWDTHGLPVEIEVEKKLGLDGKEQIEKYGIAPFIRQCKESVWKYKAMWEDFSESVGFWADMENPYITYDNSYIESVWWSLKKIWDRGLLYKGFKVVPYCPRCGTPLSGHEVAQGYRDVKETSAIVAFRIKGTDNEYFLAWTTTPWTLPSNVALCVNAGKDYVKVEKIYDNHKKFFILAEALLSVLDGEFKITDKFKGSDLVNKEYEPLFSFPKPDRKAYYVVADDFVTLTEGTGIVHIAPAFGEDDSRIGRKYGLPFLQSVDSKGQMTEETPWAGIFCKDADKEILKELRKEGKLFKTLPYEHSYPFCWRCDTPLIYYARESWYIKMTAVKDELLANNNTVNWIPETIGKGRFGDWLENVQDWAISRDRYWGTPLPIWECTCGHRHLIGSFRELREKAVDPDLFINGIPEPHRPYIDAVRLRCPVCGKEMTRIREVIDCWYDSGAMPFAQWHYPFENADVFADNFPADFISEAVDQTRGWFYSLLAVSTLIFGKAPYKNVIVLGLVQDEQGRKMSKSKGNAVDPFDALAKYGADAIRWYFYSNSALWLPNRFYDKAVIEGQRKVMGTLWNTYAFYILYAEIDGFNPYNYNNGEIEYEKLTVLDKWIISGINTLVKTADDNLEHYRITETAKAIEKFIDDLSNWYVRRSRERFWVKGMPEDKIKAYLTLFNCIVTLCKTAAPMLPFITEEIYRNIVLSVNPTAPESIHLCEYPKVHPEQIDKNLEAVMDEVLNIVALGRNARNLSGIKTRQPLRRMFVKGKKDFSEGKKSVNTDDIIIDELNVKEIVYTDDIGDFVSYLFKPDFKIINEHYGKNIGSMLGLVGKALKEIDAHAAMKQLKEEGSLHLHIGSGEIKLRKEDLLIETVSKPGYAFAEGGGYAVILDTSLDSKLIEEGFANELVSKVQTMRKEAGFEVTDHIDLMLSGNERIEEIVRKRKEDISRQLLADKIFYDDDSSQDYAKEWNLNGENIRIAVRKRR